MKNKKITIFSDFKSSLQAIEIVNSKREIVRQIHPLKKLYCGNNKVSCRLLNGVVDSRSALQAEGLEFNPRPRHESHKLFYLK